MVRSARTAFFFSNHPLKCVERLFLVSCTHPYCHTANLMILSSSFLIFDRLHGNIVAWDTADSPNTFWMVCSIITKFLTKLNHGTLIWIFSMTVIKPDQHICKFSENSKECWMRTGKHELYGSLYLYVLSIWHYAPNTFSAFPNLSNQRMLLKVLANTVCANQFSRLLVNLCENTCECRWIFGIFLFSSILRELMYVWIRLYTQAQAILKQNMAVLKPATHLLQTVAKN